MGLFQEMQQVVNRAPVDITVTFDGQQITLSPGEHTLPKIAVPNGKNQNPVMGSADPNNPHISGADYLLGVVGEDNCTPLTKEEWATHLDKPCRVNEQEAFQERYGSDPKARLIVMGKGKKAAATSRAEASDPSRGNANFAAEK